MKKQKFPCPKCCQIKCICGKPKKGEAQAENDRLFQKLLDADPILREALFPESKKNG